jgi:hypothetical protein
MRIETVAAIIKAPRDKVLSFLSNVENLPKWATEFCKKLEKVEGRYYVTSCQGRMLFEMRADHKTGVLDMAGGPTESQMTLWPARVVPLPNGNSAFLFTVIQGPGVPDAEFQNQLEALGREMLNVKNALE